MTSPSGETSYVITNALECHPIVADSAWLERGAAAYMGLNRTDPDAIWSFQGWAIIDWDNTQQGGMPCLSCAIHSWFLIDLVFTGSSFRGFVDSVPPGKFVVIDMSVDGSGEWQKWNNASFFGAPYIWTTLHDFGNAWRKHLHRGAPT